MVFSADVRGMNFGSIPTKINSYDTWATAILLVLWKFCEIYEL